MTPLPPAVVFAAWAVTLILGVAIGAAIAWQIAFDRGFEEACGNKRHRHRVGSPQETTPLELPREGRPLEPLPRDVEWAFFGAQVEPQPGRDEYALLTRKAWEAEHDHRPGELCNGFCRKPEPSLYPAPASTPADDAEDGEDEDEPWTPTGDIAKMIAETDEFIEDMVEGSNYYQHTILAEHLTSRSEHEDGA